MSRAILREFRGNNPELQVAVVIPCYKVKDQILKVLQSLPEAIHKIYVIDDCCPQQSGQFVLDNFSSSKLTVLFNKQNLGVGGAVKRGYQEAIKDKIDVVVKVDGDGQMDPALIEFFIRPIAEGEADYSKGNRFYNLESLTSMPTVRLLGNACLSFINKAVSGYWSTMDPTNGYTAISRFCLERLPLDKIENRYFFESDMLFRLGTLRAVVADIAMDSVYADEQSNMNIRRVIFNFPCKFISRFIKRIFYTYFLRDFSVASIALLLGSFLTLSSIALGIYSWAANSTAGTFASSGTVMLAGLPIIVGIQLLLIAVVIDILNVPKTPLTRL